MLVISRKKGESLLIDRAITITILKGFGGETRLGIEAPKHIRIMRAELLSENNFHTPPETFKEREMREHAMRKNAHFTAWIDNTTDEHN